MGLSFFMTLPIVLSNTILAFSSVVLPYLILCKFN